MNESLQGALLAILLSGAKGAAVPTRRGFGDVQMVRGGMNGRLEHAWLSERGSARTEPPR